MGMSEPQAPDQRDSLNRVSDHGRHSAQPPSSSFTSLYQNAGNAGAIGNATNGVALPSSIAFLPGSFAAVPNAAMGDTSSSRNPILRASVPVSNLSKPYERVEGQSAPSSSVLSPFSILRSSNKNGNTMRTSSPAATHRLSDALPSSSHSKTRKLFDFKSETDFIDLDAEDDSTSEFDADIVTEEVMQSYNEHQANYKMRGGMQSAAGVVYGIKHELPSLQKATNTDSTRQRFPSHPTSSSHRISPENDVEGTYGVAGIVCITDAPVSHQPSSYPVLSHSVYNNNDDDMRKRQDLHRNAREVGVYSSSREYDFATSKVSATRHTENAGGTDMESRAKHAARNRPYDTTMFTKADAFTNGTLSSTPSPNNALMLSKAHAKMSHNRYNLSETPKVEPFGNVVASMRPSKSEDELDNRHRLFEQSRPVDYGRRQDALPHTGNTVNPHSKQDASPLGYVSHGDTMNKHAPLQYGAIRRQYSEDSPKQSRALDASNHQQQQQKQKPPPFILGHSRATRKSLIDDDDDGDGDEEDNMDFHRTLSPHAHTMGAHHSSVRFNDTIMPWQVNSHQQSIGQPMNPVASLPIRSATTGTSDLSEHVTAFHHYNSTNSDGQSNPSSQDRKIPAIYPSIEQLQAMGDTYPLPVSPSREYTPQVSSTSAISSLTPGTSFRSDISQQIDNPPLSQYNRRHDSSSIDQPPLSRPEESGMQLSSRPSTTFNATMPTNGHAPQRSQHVAPPAYASDLVLPDMSEEDMLKAAIAASQAPDENVYSVAIADIDYDLARENARQLRNICAAASVDNSLLVFAVEECERDHVHVTKLLEQGICDENLEILLDLNGVILHALELSRDAAKRAEKDHDTSSVALSVQGCARHRDIFSLICMLRAQHMERRIEAALELMKFARNAEIDGSEDSLRLRDEIRSSGGIHSLLALFLSQGIPYELRAVAALAIAYVLPAFVVAESQANPSLGINIVKCLRFLSHCRAVNPMNVVITKEECFLAAAAGLMVYWNNQCESMLHGLTSTERHSHVKYNGQMNNLLLLDHRGVDGSIAIVPTGHTTTGGGIFDQPKEVMELQELMEMSVSLIIYIAKNSNDRTVLRGVNIALLVEQACALELARPIVVKEGVLPILMSWIRSKDQEKIRLGLSSLQYLTSISDRYMAGWIHSQIVTEGAVPEIIALTQDVSLSQDARLRIAQIFSILCIAPHTRAAVMSADSLHFLIDILYEHTDDSTIDIALFAGSAIMQLAAGALSRSIDAVDDGANSLDYSDMDTRVTIIE
jgi:hypothetical protein